MLLIDNTKGRNRNKQTKNVVYTQTRLDCKNCCWYAEHDKSIKTAMTATYRSYSFRADSEIISSLLLWKPTFDHTRGRKLSFPVVISRDTGIRTQDLGTVMKDREVWRSIVDSMLSTAVD